SGSADRPPLRARRPARCGRAMDGGPGSRGCPAQPLYSWPAAAHVPRGRHLADALLDIQYVFPGSRADLDAAARRWRRILRPDLPRSALRHGGRYAALACSSPALAVYALGILAAVACVSTGNPLSAVVGTETPLTHCVHGGESGNSIGRLRRRI